MSYLPWPGLEPGSLEFQSRILPLKYQSVFYYFYDVARNRTRISWAEATCFTIKLLPPNKLSATTTAITRDFRIYYQLLQRIVVRMAEMYF